MKKISVITVCYNAVAGIERTILSIINQTYKNIEYIIIDGGSTDGTLEIIEKYRDRIDYFVSEPDNGIYDAMNKGIKAATGEWINFMNAGDEFADLQVISHIEPFWAGFDVVTGNEIAVRNGAVEDYVKAPLTLDFRFFCTDCLKHQATFVRMALQKSHPFDEELKIASDWKFWLEQLYINHHSYLAVDIDVCKFARDGISTTDGTGLAGKERRQVILELLGKEKAVEYDKLRRKNILTYLHSRLFRCLKRHYRLFKYRKYF